MEPSKRRRKSFSQMKIALIVSSIVTVLVVLFITPTWYSLNYDTDALIDRAQVAADREDMVEYLSKLKHNLETREMTTGHFALVFTTPANDLALHYKALNRILERLQSIKDISKNETAYQVALSDIRGTIRELPNPADDYMWTKYWFVFILGVGIWIWPAILISRDPY